VSETQEYIKTVNDTPGRLMYSIRPRPSEEDNNKNTKLIGLVGLNKHNRFTYLLHPSYWGAGYATEAVAAARASLFELQPDRKILIAGAFKANQGSKKVLVKCGFEEVAILGIMQKALQRRLNDSEENEVLRVLESKRHIVKADKEEAQLDLDPYMESLAFYCYVKST
jgi:RimJ/RimL family protein N-acetyltransferase